MENLTQEEIQLGLNEAYKKAGNNAYFGNGFILGINFILERLSKEKSAKENNNECKVIPINRNKK